MEVCKCFFFNKTVLYGAIHSYLYVGFAHVALPQPGIDTITTERTGKESLITRYLEVFHQVFDINMGAFIRDDNGNDCRHESGFTVLCVKTT